MKIKTITSLIIFFTGLLVTVQSQTHKDTTLTASIPTGSIELKPELFGNITIPAKGKVISKFGPRRSRIHTGTDVKLAKGDTIVAAFDGKVNIAAPHYGYGLLVTLEHAQGVTTYYAHLSKILVQKGQAIKAGEVVGLAGMTGRATTTHLHFEVRVNSKPINSQQLFDFDNMQFTANYITPPSIKNSVKTSATEPETQLATNTTTESQPTVQKHQVKRGDTLYKISKLYGVSIAHLCEVNNITIRTILSIGQTLLLTKNQ